MTRFLQLVAAAAALGSIGMLSSPAAADGTLASSRPVKMAPDARPPSYSLARGMFLIASRGLSDPNFSESVVLLLEYDAKGALGLIVNRPTDVPLTDLLPEVEELKERSDVVYVGGPVSKNRIVLLMRSEQHPRESGRVFADTYVSSSMETLKHALAVPFTPMSAMPAGVRGSSTTRYPGVTGTFRLPRRPWSSTGRPTRSGPSSSRKIPVDG